MPNIDYRQAVLAKAAQYYEAGDLKNASVHLKKYFNSIDISEKETPDPFAFFMRGYLKSSLITPFITQKKSACFRRKPITRNASSMPNLPKRQK